MKVIVCEQPGRLAPVTTPIPCRPVDGLLARVRCVGRCGTDTYLYDSDRPFPDARPIMGPGRAGSLRRSGQTVTSNPVPPCGRCRPCQQGRGHRGIPIQVPARLPARSGRWRMR